MSMDLTATSKPLLTANVCIPFFTDKDAEIAYNTLRVDKEPPRGGCVKTLSVEGKNLNISYTATDPKKLRVGINSFMDSLTLVIETIQMFGGSIDT
ncbi:hypothetical protein EB796_022269 [Bugula neritina]|uniref:L antigen family member 3 n=1 Tax=Bugula neritina TaxID=10212 RepID=A0A7J7IZT4_BUGNE|nr:hypothetical protein EB796_022269 [Bugula neritina]